MRESGNEHDSTGVERNRGRVFMAASASGWRWTEMVKSAGGCSEHVCDHGFCYGFCLFAFFYGQTLHAAHA